MNWHHTVRTGLVVVLLATGCGGAPSPGSFSLWDDVSADRYVLDKASATGGLGFARRPQLAQTAAGQERRPVVITGAEGWSWTGEVPKSASLHFGVQRYPWSSSASAWRIECSITAGGRSETRSARLRPAAQERWLDFDIDLSRFAGEQVRVELRAVVDSGPDAESRWAWAATGISAPGPAARPNVLFIVVDTLRADHLATYGYQRPTAPNIDSLLAARGVVVERAYAQAPWTLPSAVSFHTSRYPGEILGDDLRTFGIPKGVGTLAEWMARQGYRTAGFMANRTLHAGNGFDRGFSTFYTPPAVGQSMLLHGEQVNRRARPWLRAHQREPFFLYLHYLDPHDPYDNPEIVGGRSPFYPGYSGGLSGLWVHGIYAGRIPLQDPVADVRHLGALYDSEIHYVDARIGELLADIAPEVLANTLVVLTSDHGEELYDHGGWKHGQTLYEEQIRVPLIVRWDARLTAGRRVAGPVRLLDLLPTMAAAVGRPADPSWQGTNLLPALAGESPLPRLPVFAQHHATGPLRAAAIVDGKKLMVFNRRSPFVPGDGLQAHLWRLDLARLARTELYDLERDPGEHLNLAADRSAVAMRLPVIRRQLDRQLPGVRIMASGLPAGSRLEGWIRFDRPVGRWLPHLLDEHDRVELAADGAVLRFSLTGEPLEKGFLVEGSFSALTALEARWAAPGAAPIPVLLGGGSRYGGGAVPLVELSSAKTPELPIGPALSVWLRPDRGTSRVSEPANAETVARLRALGYLQ